MRLTVEQNWRRMKLRRLVLWRRRRGRRRRKRTEKKIGERDQKPTVLSTNSERFVQLISKFKLKIEEQVKLKEVKIIH